MKNRQTVPEEFTKRLESLHRVIHWLDRMSAQARETSAAHRRLEAESGKLLKGKANVTKLRRAVDDAAHSMTVLAALSKEATDEYATAEKLFVGVELG